MVTHIIQKLYL